MNLDLDPDLRQINEPFHDGHPKFVAHLEQVRLCLNAIVRRTEGDQGTGLITMIGSDNGYPRNFQVAAIPGDFIL